MPDSIANNAMPHVMNTYARLAVSLSHGNGVWVWDDQGKQYLDALGGIAVNTLGHAHPKLVAALHDQLGKMIHCSNYYQIPLQEQLAAKLVEKSGMRNVFFCNSGLEANEAAIKLARKFGHNKGFDAPEMVVFENAFHGRSLATLSATANPKVQAGFAPLVGGFLRVAFNDINAIQTLAKQHPQISAVMIETIQGEGGVNPARMEFLKSLRTLCDENDWLLIVDEVQCGMGRTGKWFAHQWAGIVPDVMPLAKGLASGIPIGAVVCGAKAANIFQPGNHGSTFGGNPLAMRAGIETIAVMEAEKLLANAADMGHALRTGIQKKLSGVSGVVDIRGQGLMLGIELDRPCAELVTQALQAGLLISVTNENVVRLLPPLVINNAEVDQVIERLSPLITTFLQTPKQTS